MVVGGEPRGELAAGNARSEVDGGTAVTDERDLHRGGESEAARATSTLAVEPHEQFGTESERERRRQRRRFPEIDFAASDAKNGALP